MTFIKMEEPLKYPVYKGKTKVIPAGAVGVEIAFRQSQFSYWDENLKKRVRLNVYRYNGETYNA